MAWWVTMYPATSDDLRLIPSPYNLSSDLHVPAMHIRASRARAHAQAHTQVLKILLEIKQNMLTQSGQLVLRTDYNSQNRIIIYACHPSTLLTMAGGP